MSRLRLALGILTGRVKVSGPYHDDSWPGGTVVDWCVVAWREPRHWWQVGEDA